jgi:hypothetical protein
MTVGLARVNKLTPRAAQPADRWVPAEHVHK